MNDHAWRAVVTGIEMRRTLAAFNQAEAAAERPTMENGIGIASGAVIAGNVGGEARIEYTVMGDAANLAKRLEGMTKEVGSSIVISAETYQEVSTSLTIGARQVSDVSIKGKREKVDLYALAL